MSVAVAVFASGGGTNLQALLDHFAGPAAATARPAAARIALVVSDREDAGALDRAARAGVATRVVPVGGRAETDVAEETLTVLEAAGIDAVALAGYTRLVPARVVRRYRGRMVNIHPALLPAFGGTGMYGMRVHRAVLGGGCRVSGATVHLVAEEYDTGPILAQWPVPVLAGDAPEDLAARVLRVEHRLYPAVVEALARWIAAGGTLPPADAEPPAGADRAGRGGVAGVPGPFAGPEPRAFVMTETEAPTLEEIRRALGLDRPD